MYYYFQKGRWLSKVNPSLSASEIYNLINFKLKEFIKSVKIKTLDNDLYKYEGKELPQTFQEIKYNKKVYCVEVDPKAQANGVRQVEVVFQNTSNNVKAYVVQKGRFFDKSRNYLRLEVSINKVVMSSHHLRESFF